MPGHDPAVAQRTGQSVRIGRQRIHTAGSGGMSWSKCEKWSQQSLSVPDMGVLLRLQREFKPVDIQHHDRIIMAGFPEKIIIWTVTCLTG